jgi:hypothetical protein
MTDIKALKALAEAATPGPWVKTIDGVMPEGAKFGIFGNPSAENGAANREYIAAANPAAVLELIAEIERLKGLQPDFPPRPPDGEGLPRFGLRWNGPQQPLATPMEDGYWTPWHLAGQLKTENTDLHATLQAAKGEIERLKGENEALRRGMKGDYDLDAWLDWAKEAEALRKDAQRYRFVLDCPIRTMVALSRKAHEADFDLSAECDMLMSKEASHD